MAKYKLDKEACVGCGVCSSLCSEVFSFDTTGEKVEVVMEDVPAELVESANDAMESCPVAAITSK